MKYHSSSKLFKVVLVTVLIAAAITAVVVVSQVPSTHDVVVEKQPTKSELVELEVERIFNSGAFQEEMRAEAKARALSEMATDKIRESAALSDMAQVSRKDSQRLKSEWLEQW